MNLLQKQGVLNSVILYIGIALGFFNSIILFQRFLTLEEIGFFGLLTTLSILYTQVASLGLQSVITRYFPFFRTEDKQHGGFPLFVIGAAVAGFLAVTLVFLCLKEFVFSFFEENKGLSLMSRYHFSILPLSLVTLFYLIQEAIARTAYKSIVPAFLREVMLKVFTSLGVLMIAFRWINFKEFIDFYLATNVLILLLLFWYVKRVKVYKVVRTTHEVKMKAKEMVGYGLFSMISGSAVALIPTLGLIILKMLNGEQVVGIYVTFSAIATVISLPAKALNTTSYQIIADAWTYNDLKKIGKIYHKTSIVQLVIGLLLLVGLIINKRNLLYLLHKPEYIQYFDVFILLAVGFLIDITGGLNQAIISFSKYYKVIMRFLLAGVVVSFIINYSLISLIGITGAACSYVLTMFVLNFGYWLYLKTKFGLQPFTAKHLKVVVIGLLSLSIGLYLPDLTNYYLDVIYRSVLVSILYISSIYFLNISEDINDLLNKVLMRKR